MREITVEAGERGIVTRVKLDDLKKHYYKHEKKSFQNDQSGLYWILLKNTINNGCFMV